MHSVVGLDGELCHKNLGIIFSEFKLKHLQLIMCWETEPYQHGWELQKAVSSTCLHTPTLIWMVVVIQIFLRIFNIKEETLNGISFTLDILRIKIKLKFILNGPNQKILLNILTQDITLHQNSISSQEEINITLVLMAILHKPNLILVKDHLLLTRISTYQKIHFHLAVELIHIIKINQNHNQKLNQILKFLIIQKDKKYLP